MYSHSNRRLVPVPVELYSVRLLVIFSPRLVQSCIAVVHCRGLQLVLASFVLYGGVVVVSGSDFVWVF